MFAVTLKRSTEGNADVLSADTPSTRGRFFLDRLCMRSQDVHDMLRKPKYTAQTPLAAAAWETYLRVTFMPA